MKLSEGRNFSRDFPTDSSSTSPCVIVNQTLANVFGWGDHAIGHQVKVFTNNTGGTMGLRVIGVVEDFHFKSLHEKINPLMMVLQKSPGLIMRIKTRDLSGLLTHIKTIWNQYQPEEPFTYAFLDQLYNQTYQSEEKTGTILDLFAGLTIFIACMGLLGLAIYTTEQRTKEIGIRKVMGASAAQVVGMLSREFLLWVMISCLIAFPLSYWAMKEWLRNFAYQIQISWWIFIMAALGAFIITLITISFQAIKAAVSNPVKSLRSE
jgi:putative ABC transport system permease protein